MSKIQSLQGSRRISLGLSVSRGYCRIKCNSCCYRKLTVGSLTRGLQRFGCLMAAEMAIRCAAAIRESICFVPLG